MPIEQLDGNRSSAARASSIFSPAMLPLVSSAMPRLTGTRSALKCVTSTGLIVFVDEEVVLLQPGHEPAARRPTPWPSR